jgi:tRNA threonylcarbamoyladenosine biosynthesis protein TsaB
MRVLAIDTALAACSVAVLDTERGAILASESRPMLRGHAEALMPLLERVVTEAEMALTDLDRIAVTTGPGSFTGLRVGIAAARGIALATGRPAVGLSTLAAYAAPHMANDNTLPIVAAIDARHAQVYLQVFAPGGRTFTAPRLASLREAAEAAGQAPACIVGSAAGSVAAALSAAAQPAVRVDERPAPDVCWVARMGAVAAEGQAPPKPQYLRAPDAQPQYAAQLPRR